MESLAQLTSLIRNGFRLQSAGELFGGEWIYERISELLPRIRSRETVAIIVRDSVACLTALLAVWAQQGRVLLIDAERPAGTIDQILELEHPDLILREVAGHKFEEIRPVKTGAFTPARCGLNVYTSGTTGLPKCVIFDEEALIGNIRASVETFKITNRDTIFCPVLSTLTGVLMMVILPSIAAGAKMILPKITSPSNVIRKLEESETTIIYGVPFWYELLVKSPSWKTFRLPSSVRMLLSSSAFLSLPVIRQVHEKMGLFIRSIYCSSEIGMCTFNSSDDEKVLSESVGRHIEGVELRIFDENGVEVEPYVSGRIYVRSPYCASGYGNVDEEVTQGTFTEQGIFTGDRGWLDDRGHLYLLGREAVTFNIAGYLVYPQEVEAVLGQAPGVEDVIVYAEQQNGAGAYLVADLVGAGDEETLVAACLKHLSKYKIPRRFNHVAEIPRNGAGKKVYPRLQEVVQ